MATSQNDWTVERMGSNKDRVELKMRDAANCDKLLQLEHCDGDVVEIRVDGGAGEIVGGGQLPEWAEAAVDRIGVRV